jgi:hypothetical protein
MSKQAAEKTTTATSQPKAPVIREGKDAIYERLGSMVKEMTGKRIGITGGRAIFDKVVEEIFVEATKEGTFRFNGGFGSMHIKTYQAGSRRLPSGQMTTFDERQKLRYEEGVVVAGLVQHKGDLAKVQSERKEASTSDSASEAVDASDSDSASSPENEVELS